MKLRLFVIAVYVMAMILAVSCNSSHTEDEHGHNDHVHSENEHFEEVDEHRNPEHSEGNVIVFAPEKAQRYGVITKAMHVAPVATSYKVTGEILSAPGECYTVTAPVSGIVKMNARVSQGAQIPVGTAVCVVSAKDMTGGDANAQAKVNYDAAKRELDRLKPLYEDKIVTQKEYNAVLQAYEIAKNAYIPTQTNQGVTAKSKLSGTVTAVYVTDGQFVEAGSQIADIDRNANLLLRADLPEANRKSVATISDANIYTEDGAVSVVKELNGKRVSPDKSITVASGYVPVYFEFKNDGTFASGAFVEVYLISNSAAEGIMVPIKAVVEELGNYYVYISLDEDCYEKRAVSLGMSDGNYIFITNGINEGDNVVVEGTTYIRLAGNSSEIPAGCEHHH